jgi:hypothetical protein
MIKIITSSGPTYEATMQQHEERLNNLENYGRVQTHAEMAAQTRNLPELQARYKIHGVYPTIYNYGNHVMYTTVVCFEPAEEEREEEKNEYGKPMAVRIS